MVYFLGGKGGLCVGLTTLPPSFVWKSGSLNLEPSRPVQTCNGIALLFLLPPPLPQNDMYDLACTEKMRQINKSEVHRSLTPVPGVVRTGLAACHLYAA